MADSGLPDIIGVEEQTGNASSLSTVKPIYPVAVAFDEIRFEVYWTDVASFTINKVSLSSLASTVIFTDRKLNVSDYHYYFQDENRRVLTAE